MTIRLPNSSFFLLLFFTGFTATEQYEAKNIYSVHGKDTLHVVVKPVDYDQHSWKYWGFTNDWFQEELVTKMNSVYRKKNIQCFTEEDARSRNITPDKIIEISLINIEVKNPKRNQYSTQASRRVITGYTNSTPMQPIYSTVYATVLHDITSVSIKAQLQYRMYIPGTDLTILQEQFPIAYTWSHDSPTIMGDERAAGAAVVESAKGVNFPPSDNEMIQLMGRLQYENLIEKLKKKIK